MAILETWAWERIGEKFMLDVAKVRWVVCEKERPIVCGEQGVLRRMGRRSMMVVYLCLEWRACESIQSNSIQIADLSRRLLYGKVEQVWSM